VKIAGDAAVGPAVEKTAEDLIAPGGGAVEVARPETKRVNNLQIER
jgi:hypothetical protein